MTASTATLAMPPSRSGRVPPPTWLPASAGGIRVDLKKVAIPVSLALLAVITFGFELPVIWVTALSILFPAVYAAVLLGGQRAMKRFEQEFNRLLAHGDVDAISELWERSRWTRLLAPGYRMRAKRGLLLSLQGEHRRAVGVLEEAYELAPKRERAALLGPIARAKFAAGDASDLREVAEQWRARSPFAGAPNVYLAAAILRDPTGDRARARELLADVDGRVGATERELAARLCRRIDDDDEASQ